MRIQTVVELSGLSRGQINQLISRWGIKIRAKALPGGAREFEPVDVFELCIAGRAAGLGLDMPSIRDLIMSIPFDRRDSNFNKIEMFSGCALGGETILASVPTEYGFKSCFVSADTVGELLKDEPAALVFPASAIARNIEGRSDA